MAGDGVGAKPSIGRRRHHRRPLLVVASLAVVMVIVGTVLPRSEAVRREVPDFVLDFPPGIDPMVIDVRTEDADSGAATLSPDGDLLGIHSWGAIYQYVNLSGNFFGPGFRLAYEQPVWRYVDWIRRTISGEGPSNHGPPGHDELKRRRLLTREQSGDLPMTMPPQVMVCDPGDDSCHLPDPRWVRGTLAGGGNYRGTALARCAAAAGNRCSFGGLSYPAGAQARFSLGPASAPAAPGERKVLAWCTTDTAFPSADSPTRHVLRVSLTNDDSDDIPLGYGWWDLSPDQVTDPTTKASVELSHLNTC